MRLSLNCASSSLVRKSNLGRPRISRQQVVTLERSRRMGHTLSDCAFLANVHMATAYTYTRHIVCSTRRNKGIKINRKTGAILAA